MSKGVKENLDKINWSILSTNPQSIEILKENQNKIDWYMLSTNPAIFTYDYEEMRNSNIVLKEEIISTSLNPKRIFKLLEDYNKINVYYLLNNK